jgi:hypothetical protein
MRAIVIEATALKPLIFRLADDHPLADRTPRRPKLNLVAHRTDELNVLRTVPRKLGNLHVSATRPSRAHDREPTQVT